MRSMARCRVLVAGGGPAGLSSAIALAGRGIDVCIVDLGGVKYALKRCEMLPAAAHAILQRLGLSNVLDQSVALRGVVSLWGSEQPVDHSAASPGMSKIGWSIDRSQLDKAMRARITDLGVRVIQERVRSVVGRAGTWTVSLSNGLDIRAEYLIDATGRPAALARRLGAKAVFGAPLIAWVGSTGQSVEPYLMAEARPSGWCYCLPEPGGGASVGYLSGGRDEPTQSVFNDTAVATARLVPDLIKDRAVGPVDSRSMRLFPSAAPGWIATGDAAAAFDPVASQGLFNALSGGFFAGNAAADALDDDEMAVDIYRTLADRTASRTHRQIPHQYAAHPYETQFWRRMSRRFPASKGAFDDLQSTR